MVLFEFIKGVLLSSYELMTAMAPYLLFGFFFAGILKEFVSAEKIAVHLGRSSIGSVIKAALFGIPLPLCSCGVIPPTMALRKAGASKGAVLSFLIATPTSGVDSIAATYSLLGPFFAAFRVVASFLAGIFSGVAANLLDHKNVPPQQSEPLLDDYPKPRTLERISNILRYAFIELLAEIGKWLVIGILIGGLITYVIPDSFFADSILSGWQAILMMLLVSVPLYVCATGSIPIAAALLIKGINPGAAFVFLLAGPATNAVTMTVITKYLGKRTATIYISTLVFSSIILGLLLDLFWDGLGLSMSGHHLHHQMIPKWLEVLSAIFLGLMLAYVLLRNSKLFSPKHFTKTKESNMLSEFTVPDMTCNNCVMHVEKALKNVEGVENVVIDLGSKKVNVEHADQATMDKLMAAVSAAGYTAKEA